jgi:hypothetical protein
MTFVPVRDYRVFFERVETLWASTKSKQRGRFLIEQ